MAIRLNKEEQLLDQAFRKKVIEDIKNQENINRKNMMFRRHDMYRDNTKAYVAEVIRVEQGDEALSEIQHRVSNLSILKTVINKKAMIYANGARRYVIAEDKTKQEQAQEQIDKVVDLINFNTIMKKTNRWEELFKNGIVQVYPYKNDITKKWRIKLDVNLPYKLDVLEDEYNNEEGRCYIYSYFAPQTSSLNYAPIGQSSIHSGNLTVQETFRAGDGINQDLQAPPKDEKMEYVWWSTKYHFTTDEKGVIINQSENIDSTTNPVQDIPYVNIATAQDGNFWAVGGEDLSDGSVLINLFLTEIYYIAKYQGMGLFYLFGRGVPKRIKVGPSQAITLDVKPDDPTPQIGFATSNPNIAEYMSAIKEYVSALMKTNKLEPSTIIGLESALQAASGVQELIQKSELNESLEDAKEIYRDAEPMIFDKYIKWHNYLFDKMLLDDEFAEIGRIPEDIKVVTKFNDPQSTMTEKEKLEVIKMRQDIGLDSLSDSIMRDNPDLSKKEAEEKALEILKRKTIDARQRMIDAFKADNKSSNQMQTEMEDDEMEDDEMEEEDDDDMMEEEGKTKED